MTDKKGNMIVLLLEKTDMCYVGNVLFMPCQQ
jgi:hypothetical protein